MKKSANGYATKNDLHQLEKRINTRFRQVDKRFAQVDKRFAQVDKRLEEVELKIGWLREQIRADLEQFKLDTFTEFDSRWITRIDPILADIVRHREQEVIWAEQNRHTNQLLEKIAAKVGVSMRT